MSDFGETPPNHPSITYMLRRFLRPNTKTTSQSETGENANTKPPVEIPQEHRKALEVTSRTTPVGFFSRPGLDRTNKGWELRRNEDVTFAEKGKNGIVYGFVADGISGTTNGHHMAAKIGARIADKNRPIRGFNDFHSRIKEGYHNALKDRNFSSSTSGTTFTGFVVEGNVLKVAHVGDSKLFILRGDDKPTQVTTNHHEPGWESFLTKSIDTVYEFPEMEIVEKKLQDGDIVFVCSDGIPERYVNTNNLKLLYQKINNGFQPSTVLKEFVDEIVDQKSANAKTHVDDASVVIYRHQTLK